MQNKESHSAAQSEELKGAVSPKNRRLVTRRNFIRTGAVLGAGLVASTYVKPDFQSIKVPHAFAQASAPPTTEGKLSIEFRPNDVGEVYTGTTSYTFQAPLDLCNVSNAVPVTVESWAFTVTVLQGATYLNPQDSSGVQVPTSFPMLTAGPPDACYPFPVTFQLGSNWAADAGAKIKVRIVATATSVGGQVVSSNGNGLILTLAKNASLL